MGGLIVKPNLVNSRLDLRPYRLDLEPERSNLRLKRGDLRANRLPKGNMWLVIPVALLCMVVNERKQGSGPEGDEVLQNTEGILFVHPSVHLPVRQSLPGPLRPEI